MVKAVNESEEQESVICTIPSHEFPLTNILPCHKPSIDPGWYI